MLGIKNKVNGQEMRILQVIGTTKYVNLEFGNYNAWNVKVD